MTAIAKTLIVEALTESPQFPDELTKVLQSQHVPNAAAKVQDVVWQMIRNKEAFYNDRCQVQLT